VNTALQKLYDFVALIWAGVFTGTGAGAGLSGTGGATGPGVAAIAGGGGAPARGALAVTPQTAPSAPSNGDFWSTAAAFFVRIAGSTFTMALLEAAQTFTGSPTFAAASGPGLTATPSGGASPVRGNVALSLITTPSAPQNGDIWADSTHFFGVRVNGITRNIHAQASVFPTFGATVPIDTNIGTFFLVVATSGAAFTISSASGGIAGRRITVLVRNTSGGALGVITWGATYRLATFANPANGFSRSIDFTYDSGTGTWIEISRTPADVPN
jgi:hypothetical protein